MEEKKSSGTFFSSDYKFLLFSPPLSLLFLFSLSLSLSRKCSHLILPIIFLPLHLFSFNFLFKKREKEGVLGEEEEERREEEEEENECLRSSLKLLIFSETHHSSIFITLIYTFTQREQIRGTKVRRFYSRTLFTSFRTLQTFI